MYKTNNVQQSSLNVNKSYVGETIEQKVARITNNKEPISDGAPLVYTDRSEGVQAQYNIKTDRFEIALEATDAITKAHQAKREERAKAKEEAKVVNLPQKNDGGTEPTQGTTTR